MSQLQALTALRDKVNAGDDWHRAMYLWQKCGLPHGEWFQFIWSGSFEAMSAAKALHEAVLPDFIIHRIGQRFGGTWEADVMQIGPDGWHDAKRDARFSVFNDDPARALLLADLHALIAKHTQRTSDTTLDTTPVSSQQK